MATEIIIEAGLTEKNYWKDLWRFRELFYILSWRDIKVRYKQTVIGAAWGIIRPLLTTIILTVVFSRIAGLKNPGPAPKITMMSPEGAALASVSAPCNNWEIYTKSTSAVKG